MPRRNNRLIFLILGLLAMTVVWSCSQPDDVLTGISSTKVSLTAERLPTLPDGMAYELWVANEQDTVSICKFLYDQVNGVYLNLDSTTRSDEFLLSSDIYSYKTLFVSVETNPDNNTASPGPIMLLDDVTDPTEDPINLLFPEKDSLWRATARFNMEAVSDNSSALNDGRGVWFTSYLRSSKYFPDTTFLEVDDIDSQLVAVDVECEVDSDGNTLSCDTTNWDELYAYKQHYIDSIWYETTLVAYGPDTLLLGPERYHIGARVHVDSFSDSNPPWYSYTFTINTIVDTQYDALDIFSQGDLGVPTYQSWGWHYKGWVVSPYIDTSVVASRMTPPAWPYTSLFNTWITGAGGALISTGSFYKMNEPDLDGNPFAISDKVPSYPGEDFLNTTALQDSFGVTSVNFAPLSSGNLGTVFITLEPDNFSSRTNFPLFVFVEPVPSDRTVITRTLVQIGMTNWTSSLDNDLRGFPKIKIAIERF